MKINPRLRFAGAYRYVHNCQLRWGQNSILDWGPFEQGCKCEGCPGEPCNLLASSSTGDGVTGVTLLLLENINSVPAFQLLQAAGASIAGQAVATRQWKLQFARCALALLCLMLQVLNETTMAWNAANPPLLEVVHHGILADPASPMK